MFPKVAVYFQIHSINELCQALDHGISLSRSCLANCGPILSFTLTLFANTWCDNLQILNHPLYSYSLLLTWRRRCWNGRGRC